MKNISLLIIILIFLAYPRASAQSKKDNTIVITENVASFLSESWNIH